MLMIRGPMEFLGTPQAPILIEADTQTDGGQGIFVLNAAASSRWQYVQCRGLSNPSQENWSLTGAVTFYNSDLDMEHCLFSGNRCEDALNLVHSKFYLNDLTFEDTQADALDADFSSGKIEDSRFLRIGNDAMDVSGGSVMIQNTLVDQAGDKGLSAGERANVTVKNLQISNAHIAVASKDLSVVESDTLRISRSEIGLAVYQKKTEYGPGT